MDQSQPVPPNISLHPRASTEECRAVPDMLGHIADKWPVLIIGNLAYGPLRYKQLQRAVEGISQRMLTLTLKSLEQDGLVSRTVFATVPPRVDYALTDLGSSLTKALHPLHDWVMAHRDEILAARDAYRRKEP